MKDSIKRYTSMVLVIAMLTSSLIGCQPKKDMITGTLGPENPLVGTELLSINMGSYPLSKEAQVSIQPVKTTELEGVTIQAFDFQVDTDEPLMSVMELTLPYPTKDLSGQNPEGNIGVAYYNETTNEWEPVSFRINADKGTVTIFTDHLSTYGCFAVKNENTRKAYAAYAIPSFAIANLQKADANTIITNAVQNGGSPDDDAIEAGLQILDVVLALGSASTETVSHVLNSLSGVSETVAGNSLFNNIGSRLGDLGLLCSIAQVSYGMYNIYNGDTDAIFPCYADALKGGVSYIAEKTGMKLVNLSLLGVLCIEYSINTFGEAAWEGRQDIYKKAYEFYYQSEGVKRSARDWAVEFLNARSTAATPQKYQLRVEGLVQRYVDQFWQDETIVAEYQSLAQNQGFTGGGGLNEKMKEEISNAYKTVLFKGVIQDAFKLIAEKDARNAEKDLLNELNAVRKELNRVCTLQLYDGRLTDDMTKSEMADMKAYISLPDSIDDAENWSATLDQKGNGNIKFTFLAYMMAGLPGELKLYEKNAKPEDTPTETLTFVMNDTTTRLNIAPILNREVAITVLNASGETVVMDTSFDLEHFDVDAYDITDYTCDSGQIGGGMMTTVEVMEKYALWEFTETSPTTYEVAFYCMVASLPSDEDESYVYLNPDYGQTAFVHKIIVKGTYGSTAELEWDGASLIQTK